MEEVKRKLGSVQGSFVEVYDFHAVRSMVSRHYTEIISLHQAAMSAPAPESTGKLPLPLYYSDRSTLPNFLKPFRTWTKGHGTESALISEESIHVKKKKVGCKTRK